MVSIVPTVLLPPDTSFTFQVTAVFVEKVTRAVNCCVCVAATVTDAGETEIGAFTVTLALADLLVSAAESAVTLTVFGLGAVAGAVYRPLWLTVPIVLLPPTTSFTFQVTDTFVLPVTVAVNCCVFPSCKEAVVGEIVTVTPAVEGVAIVGLLLPHAASIAVMKSATATAKHLV